MKAKRIYFFFFSFFVAFTFAQTEPEAKEKNWKYEPNFLVGVDALNLGMSFFSNRKIYQGFISSRVKNNIHGIMDAGYEKNIYNKNGYNAEAKGPFVKLGAFYMLVTDPENVDNGFYLGGKLAAAFYRQHYFAVPVRGYGGSTAYVAFDPASQSSYWIEGIVGGRVQLFNSDFYIDANVQPKYLVATSKQEELQPMIVPGFGKSSAKFSIGFMWNLAYRF